MTRQAQAEAYRVEGEKFVTGHLIKTFGGDVVRYVTPASGGGGHYVEAREPIERDPGAAQQRLARLLTTARLAANKPKLADLKTATDYSESTLSRVFSGKVTPSHKLLVTLAEVFNVEMSTLTTVWEPLWRVANTEDASKPETPAPAQKDAPTTADVATGVPAGFECPSCGSWVVNAAKHIEWHVELERGAGQNRPGGHLRSA